MKTSSRNTAKIFNNNNGDLCVHPFIDVFTNVNNIIFTIESTYSNMNNYYIIFEC